MLVSRQIIAEKIATYLHHELTLPALIDWAEGEIVDGEFDSSESRDVAARLGLADSRAFGLTWEDCEQLLRKLGFNAHIEIVAARAHAVAPILQPDVYGASHTEDIDAPLFPSAISARRQVRRDSRELASVL